MYGLEREGEVLSIPDSDISVISKLLSNDILDFENYMSTNFALRTPDLPLYESASFI
jgi:hypothetical protein